MDQLAPPKPLDLSNGNLAENYKFFEQSFKIYLSATGIEEKTDKQKAYVLLHVMGPEALKVYNGFTWRAAEGGTPAENKENFEDILKKFKEYCTRRSNISLERHKFYKRVQGATETFDNFYTSLCHLSKTCAFDNLTDEMVKDRILCGIKSKELQQRYLRQTDLTLAKAVDLGRAWEATSVHTVSLQPDKAATVGRVQRGRGRGFQGRRGSRGAHRGSHQPQPQQQQTQPQFSSRGRGQYRGGPRTFRGGHSKCGYCGYETHDRKDCPARDSECWFCQQKGHYERVCRKKSRGQSSGVNEVTGAEAGAEASYEFQESDEFFLGALALGGIKETENGNQLSVPLKLSGKDISFKIDTGADVTVISNEQYQANFGHIKLQS